VNKYKYGTYELRPYQAEGYESAGGYIRKLPQQWKENKSLTGAFIEASVGAGKTAIMGALCNRFVEMGWPVLCLARDLKLVEQNSETFWDMDVKNSVYSASYSKAMHYKDKGVIISNEATAARALDGKAWADYAPRAIIVDECHQVPVDNEETQYMQILLKLNERCIEKHNHPVVLIGATGSPYRHTMSIIGDIWKECLYTIDTATLVGMGFLVPTIYGAQVGHDKSLDYDLSEFGIKSENGTADYSAADLAKMEKSMIADVPKLKKICDEVVRLTENRNAVMITCSGVKHCKEVAKHLPEGKSAIVHSGQAKKINDAELKRIANGEAKYLLQVGCLTTGYDEPCIDTSVILRRIGSLTLLVQLLGRGMRLLKPKHEERGLVKLDHLVLDYSGTLDEMMDLYENAILDECRAKEDKAQNKPTMICPACETENSTSARRCIGRDKHGQRCEHFFSFNLCVDRRAPNGLIISRGCGTKNDTRAKVCRHCNEWLDDPSEGLNGQHYTKDDLIPVTGFSFGLTKAADKLIAQYELANGAKPKQIFDIKSKEKWRRAEWYQFLQQHVVSKVTVNKLYRCYDVHEAMKHAHEVRKPYQVTHRKNERGFDLIARKLFLE
jgi:superfamily II DNA or RNA helicase